MRTTINEILRNPELFAGKIVNVDGILIVTEDDNEVEQITSIWLLMSRSPSYIAIQVIPIKTKSPLWKGLSTLTPRQVYPYRKHRIYDSIRTYGRVEYNRHQSQKPRFEILTSVIYRQGYSLFVGVEGVLLKDVISENSTSIQQVRDISFKLREYLGTQQHVSGTLVVSQSKNIKYFLPEDIGLVPKGTRTELGYPDEFFENLWEKYKISKMEAIQTIALLENVLEYGINLNVYLQIVHNLDDELQHSKSIFVDNHKLISLCEYHLQSYTFSTTYVKPAIIAGTIGREQDKHFARITNIDSVYIQLEHAVLKLKNF